MVEPREDNVAAVCLDVGADALVNDLQDHLYHLVVVDGIFVGLSRRHRAQIIEIAVCNSGLLRRTEVEDLAEDSWLEAIPVCLCILTARHNGLGLL